MAEDLKTKFYEFCVHGKSDKNLKEMDNKNFAKCCKDSKIIGNGVTTTDVDIVFTKFKAKGARTINYEQFKQALAELGKKRFKGKGNEEELMHGLVVKSSPANTGVTKTSKTGGVEKMTDASQYTGSHKERFDASGKGKGIEGRKDIADNSGYVNNYKGDGTYDAKVGK